MKNQLLILFSLLALSSCRKADVCMNIDDTRDFYFDEDFQINDCSERARTLDISWGDGSTDSYSNELGGVLFHRYSDPGKYTIGVTGKRYLGAVKETYEAKVYGYAKKYIGTWSVVEVVEGHVCFGTSLPETVHHYEMVVTGDEYTNSVVFHNFGQFLWSELYAEANSLFLEQSNSSSLVGHNDGIYDVDIHCNGTNSQDFLSPDVFELFICVDGTKDGLSCNYDSKLTLTRKAD